MRTKKDAEQDGARDLAEAVDRHWHQVKEDRAEEDYQWQHRKDHEVPYGLVGPGYKYREHRPYVPPKERRRE